MIITYLKLIADKNRPRDSTFGSFQDSAFDILPENQYSRMASYISGENFDEIKSEWDHVVEKSRTFKQFLRPIILNITFASDAITHPLITAVEFIKTTLQKGKSLSQMETIQFPKEFIPTSALKYLRDFKLISVKNKKGKFVTKKIKILQPDKYEFLVYRELFKLLDGVPIANGQKMTISLILSVAGENLILKVPSPSQKYSVRND